MNELKNKLIRFMYGRSGPDSLYKASFILYIILLIINIFARSAFISVLMTALFVWSTYRCFSRNICKRQQENIKYLQLTEKFRKKFSMLKTIITDKEHYYKKCPHCKTFLRLPRRHGNHTAVCPKCSEKIAVKIH